MAAAAAAARKPAHSQDGQGSPDSQRDRLPGWVVESGYTTVPNIVIERLMRCLTYTEFGIVLILLRQTVGGKGRPEWAKITAEEFADAKGVSVQEVSDSLKSLEFRKKLIESEKSGKGKKFRIVPERLPHAEERKLRTIEQKSEPRAVGAKETFTFDSSQPARAAFVEPASEIELVAAKDSPGFSVERSMSGSVPRFVIGIQADTITPVMVSGPSKVARSKVQTITPVMVSEGEPNALLDLLTAQCLKLHHPPPDEELIGLIKGELQDTPIECYRGVIKKRLDQMSAMQLRQVRKGLFVNFAADARKLYAAARKHGTADIWFESEPENGSSEWAMIRRELMKDVRAEYHSPLLRTRQQGFHQGVLTVVAPNRGAAHQLDADYSAVLLTYADRAGIRMDEVIFKVAEENS
jgi:hypothetical protein